ncbi:DUF4229 domain-containing protein [Gordonia caeni]|uniref:DUF4229 domain-containing protein n=1 Tax=Gordonia caeni TaxID=1007097 RepID=A0ABP7NP69_9ACTN
MSDDQAESAEKTASAASLAGWVALYTLVRMGLVVVVAAIIVGVGMLFDVEVPLLVAAVFGVLIALPIGMVAFKSVRLKVNQQIAEVDADRAARRSDLHARLRGDED